MKTLSFYVVIASLALLSISCDNKDDPQLVIDPIEHVEHDATYIHKANDCFQHIYLRFDNKVSFILFSEKHEDEVLTSLKEMGGETISDIAIKMSDTFVPYDGITNGESSSLFWNMAINLSYEDACKLPYMKVVQPAVYSAEDNFTERRYSNGIFKSNVKPKKCQEFNIINFKYGMDDDYITSYGYRATTESTGNVFEICQRMTANNDNEVYAEPFLRTEKEWKNFIDKVAEMNGSGNWNQSVVSDFFSF